MTIFEKMSRIKRDIRLDPKRKEAIRSALVRHMMTHPPGVGEPARSLWRGPLRALFARPLPIYAAVGVLAILGGGVSFAAEGALPGDLLYPVKVSVNESVRAAFAFSTEAEAEWEIARAERRLEETAALDARGEVSAEVGTKLEEKFEEHAERIRERIEKIEAQGKVGTAAELASRFEASLEAHDAILERMAVKAEEEDETQTVISAAVPPATGTDKGAPAKKPRESRKESIAVSVGAKVHSELSEIAKVRVKLEEKIESGAPGPDVRVAAEGKIKAAENVIASVRSRITFRELPMGVPAAPAGTGTVGIGIVATGSAEVSVNPLAVAEDLLRQARVKLSGGFFGEAFTLASRSLRIAQEVKQSFEFESAPRGSSTRTLPDAVPKADDEKDEGEGEIESRGRGVEIEERGNANVQLQIDL